ncbi:MAG: hypothetical protein EXQ87_11340 [Alphaproteobacteria bacterium]|nr:hypothetical protein [Alphaproteobacteria bacterium]
MGSAGLLGNGTGRATVDGWWITSKVRSVAYYLDLFTPETWQAFRRDGARVSEFRGRQRRTAERVMPGDVFICYLIRLSRWCGVLDVLSQVQGDGAPTGLAGDPFALRFDVAPRVALPIDRSVPIFEEAVWSTLSLTRDLPMRVAGWAQFANLRTSLRRLSGEDGERLSDLLTRQLRDERPYPLSDEDLRRLGQKRSIRTVEREVVVEVPEAEEGDTEAPNGASPDAPRDSIRMQAAIARIGVEMGFRVWIPRNDRQRVLDTLPQALHVGFLDLLPLNYDDTTLRTIEQIDVIWLRQRSMVRAFEIEHSTAVYSGLLRMADLLALQPNMNIRLHIIAPDERREKVLREIRRPVFSLLDRGPLYESCSYLSYTAVGEIGAMKHLGHMSDSIIDEYEEMASDD